jgi:hypothetical protein
MEIFGSAAAPKRKRPRPVKFEDESPTALRSTSGSSAAKMEAEPHGKVDTSSPKSEKKAESSAVENGVRSPQNEASTVDPQKEARKDNPISDIKQLATESDHHGKMDNREEPIPPAKEDLRTDLDASRREATAAKA